MEIVLTYDQVPVGKPVSLEYSEWILRDGKFWSRKPISLRVPRNSDANGFAITKGGVTKNTWFDDGSTVNGGRLGSYVEANVFIDPDFSE